MNLPFVPDLKTAAVVALVVGVVASIGGYKVADWRLTGKYTAEALDRAKRAEADRDEAITAYNHVAGELSKANDTHLATLRKHQNETTSLRDRLRDGAIGLRLAGKCPRLGTPEAAPGARVDTGTGAELDGTARRAYFALRDGIDRTAAQLAACQDQLKLRTQTTSVEGTQ